MTVQSLRRGRTPFGLAVVLNSWSQLVQRRAVRVGRTLEREGGERISDTRENERSGAARTHEFESSGNCLPWGDLTAPEGTCYVREGGESRGMGRYGKKAGEE